MQRERRIPHAIRGGANVLGRSATIVYSSVRYPVVSTCRVGRVPIVHIVSTYIVIGKRPGPDESVPVDSILRRAMTAVKDDSSFLSGSEDVPGYVRAAGVLVGVYSDEAAGNVISHNRAPT